jgi:hypothetical protein
MAASAALQTDTTWLRISNYEVAALNEKLAGRLPELKNALDSGIAAYPDLNRLNFYDVEIPAGWAYIHIRDDKHVVYLVAFSRN